MIIQSRRCCMAFRIGFCSGGIAPVFSSLSNKTNNFSASRSFSSSVICTPSVGFAVVPVIGLMDSPEDVVVGISLLREGALKTPLWNKKPATFPYPTRLHSVPAVNNDKFEENQGKKMKSYHQSQQWQITIHRQHLSVGDDKYS